MPQFRYSKWDGTQVGFEFDADDIFEELRRQINAQGPFSYSVSAKSGL